MMVRECDMPAATWMVRLPVAELGSIRHVESQCGVGSKVRVGRVGAGSDSRVECKISISS